VEMGPAATELHRQMVLLLLRSVLQPGIG